MAEKARKPCRYKSCKGVIHEGKCPVASSRGKKGGSGKKSETWIQNRIGSKNPNFKGTRKCGCPIRQHLPTCSQSRMSKIKINAINNHDFNNYNPLSKTEYIFDAMQDKIKITKVARKENIPLKRTVANWELENAVKVKSVPHFQFLKYDGACSSCQKISPVISASKIHAEDIKYKLPEQHFFKARIICSNCDA
tara:strand:+ start:2444 stop:3025 length:582 start_codon:yes stop_codon:yes gene_type:complete